jgi:outer membrane protein OmpA-like peptidoglycan-associated protein
MAESLATYLEAKGVADGAQRLAEALGKAKPGADEAAIQVGWRARARVRA